MGEGGKGDGERAQHGGEELRLLARQLRTVEETAREAAVAPVEVEKAEERELIAHALRVAGDRLQVSRRLLVEETLLRDVLRRCDVGGVMELRLLRGELVTACGEKGFNGGDAVGGQVPRDSE